MQPLGRDDRGARASMRAEAADTSRDVVPPALWWAFALVWLLFLYYPLLALALAHPTPVQLVMTLAGAALFVALYLRLALPLPFDAAAPGESLGSRLTALALGALIAADISLLTLLASADWLWFFIFVSIGLGARLPPRLAAVAVSTVAALAVAVGVGPFGWVYSLRVALPVAVVGFGMIGVGWLVTTIRALRAAREEIARLAVAEERLRFARDLHDLLGHSLSAITLKNEVARSLVPTQPERAVRELGEAIGLAREALREVRQAVSGYRQLSLATEIQRAQALLDAAGIACVVEGAAGDARAAPLPPTIEAVLAWGVREGVTNVVRHSGARHCAIAVLRQADTVAVEVTDDGHGHGHGHGSGSGSGNGGLSPDGSPSKPVVGGRGGSGTGLRGLAERAAQLHGQLEAGPCQPAGFRLRVTIPLSDSASVSHAERVDGGGAHPNEQGVARV